MHLQHHMSIKLYLKVYIVSRFSILLPFPHNLRAQNALKPNYDLQKEKKKRHCHTNCHRSNIVTAFINGQRYQHISTKNNACVLPSTLWITVAYEHNSSLYILETQRNARDGKRQLRYPRAYINYSPKRKKKMRKNFKSQNAALAHHITVAHYKGDSTKDSINLRKEQQL